MYTSTFSSEYLLFINNKNGRKQRYRQYSATDEMENNCQKDIKFYYLMS